MGEMAEYYGEHDMLAALAAEEEAMSTTPETIDAEVIPQAPPQAQTLAVAVRPQNQAVGAALGVEEIIAQVNLIQKVMKAVMHEGEHFGVIPGCRDNRTLFQPGAQKLCMTFRLAPEYVIQEVNIERGHKEYRVICTLKSVQSGSFVGQGVGACSTMESKYRYRGGARKCPKCGKEAIIAENPKFVRPPAVPGWMCWKKKDGCGATWAKGATEIEGQSIERQENPDPADCYNCVTPDTKVLTHDLQWVPAGEIESGDMLIGVDEEGNSDPFGRNMAIGEATVHGRKIDQLYEVAFEDGRIVRCNGEHQWLVKKIGLKGTEWASTQDIYKEIADRQGRPRHWSVMSLCHPWREDTSREAGYIAGLLDADGSLGTTQILVMFAQQANIVLSRIESALEARGFALSKDVVKTDAAMEDCVSKKHVFQLRVRGGLTEQMRALGTIRPPRLLERWLTLIDLSKRRLENRYCPAAKPARIASVTSIGEGEIVLLGTTCRTYFAEGLACHNTVLKMAKKRAFVDATITATAASDIFTQDIGDEEADSPPTGSAPSPRQATAAPARPAAAPQAAPAAPAPKPAPPAPKPATEATRAWMLKELDDIRDLAREFFTKLTDPAVLMPGDALEDLPLRFVPTTREHLKALRTAILAFGSGDRAFHSYPYGEIEAPAPAAKKPAPAAPPAPKDDGSVDYEPQGDESWRTIIVPIPRKGMKRDDYLRNPDTIGSLFDARHGTDEESAAARQRLWGLKKGGEDCGWVPKAREYNGKTYQPSQADKDFYTALKAFSEWFSANHPSEKL